MISTTESCISLLRSIIEFRLVILTGKLFSTVIVPLGFPPLGKKLIFLEGESGTHQPILHKT